LSQISLVWILLAILGHSFLQTGLFILAHDAMHGSLIPQSRWLNHRIGCLALWLYAFLPYQECHAKHRQHHRFPAQRADPDFHNGSDRHFFGWYVTFMKGYLPFWQMVVLMSNWGLIFGGLNLIWGIDLANLVLFWIVPLFISSIQLFAFGTYLPHRSTSSNSHRACSSEYPVWLSFLTCYHFGYHWEHHEYPQAPWYRLPTLRQRADLLQTEVPYLINN
jgi:beta-carotene/zeaxanthin 4-ketolase